MKQQSIFWIGICVALLVMAELILRWGYMKSHNSLVLKYAGRELCLKKHPTRYYASIPRKCGANSQGFFDFERTIQKPPGTMRIVVIGDSVAMGQGVDLEQSFPRILERKLNDSFDKDIDVVTLALSGYSTTQELSLLQEEALRYSPDLIIWSYMLNDPAHPVFHDANGELGLYFYEPKVHLAHFFIKKIFYFKEKMKSRVFHCPPEYENFLHCVYKDEVAGNIRKIAQITRQARVPVIFLIHPVFEQRKTFDEYSYFELHQRLGALAEQNNLVPVDILPIYKTHAPEELKQHSDSWHDPWHPNAKGHELVAEHLYERIVDGHYVF